MHVTCRECGFQIMALTDAPVAYAGALEAAVLHEQQGPEHVMVRERDTRIDYRGRWGK